MNKIQIGIIFGGKSAEHEISLLSAKNIIAALDRKKYEITLIGIDKQGHWHLCDHAQYLLNAHDPKKVALHGMQHEVSLVARHATPHLVSLAGQNSGKRLDVIFPVLHGTYGEDGTVQGLLKLMGIPFVGAGVLGSAVGMDKDVMKRLMRDAGIPIAKFLTVERRDRNRCHFDDVVQEIGLPLFVKPANLGSSVGVSKVKDKQEWERALDAAFAYDNKILIEENICGRELECALIGNEDPIASLPGEVIAHGHDFYSYEAKYIDDQGVCFVTPAVLSDEKIKRIQEMSIRVYKTLCCEGLARVDMFLQADGRVVVNEINTIPGFTNTSAFPKLWEASGMKYPELVDRLVELALDRHRSEKQLKTNFS
jgi:D-alanine-D-alanine ligase